MHPDLHFKFWRHQELICFNRIEDGRLVRVLSLIDLMLHLHLLLIGHVRVHAHAWIHLHLLRHVLIHHLLLTIHVLRELFIFLILLLLVHIFHGFCWWHFCHWSSLSLRNVGRCFTWVACSSHHIFLSFLGSWVLLSVSHI